MIDLITKLINYYLKEMKNEFEGNSLSAQEYFNLYGINQDIENKTSCMFACNGNYLHFILQKAFELGYLTTHNSEIITRVEKLLQNEIDKGTFLKDYNETFAKSSADLD